MKKTILFALIFLITRILYVLLHVAVYFSLVSFFNINDFHARFILIYVLIFLCISFPVATFLSHLTENNITRAYYFFSGVWMGFGMNMILLFGISWIAILVFPSIASNQKLLSTFAILLAFIYSAYGIWNNFNPRVTKIVVAIDNLPSAWVGKKIVQISDVHLGHIFGIKYFNKVVKQIDDLKPDAIVITGDLFDGTDGDLEKFSVPLNNLEAPLGIFYATGNHETYLGTHRTYAIIEKTKIMPLRDEVKMVNGLQFIGIEYPERMKEKNIEAIIKNMTGFDSSKPSILLWHTPSQIENAKKMGISLQLSGHTHKGQLFPFGLITSIDYKGYDYGFKREGKYAIYTSSGLGLWGPPMRTEKTSEIVEITLK